MKKLLLALPLIAGTSWAGTSYYAGSSTKDAYSDLLVQLNEFKPFTLVNEQYSAGIATSTAITVVKASSAPDAEILFRLHHDINHSPVGLNDAGVRFGAATIKTTLVIPENADSSASEMLQAFSSAEPIVINTNVKFDGTATHQLLVSAFESMNNGENVKFDGVDYTAIVNGKAITGTGTIGEFTVDSPMVSFKLAPGVIDIDVEKHTNGVYGGSYGVSFSELSVESAALPFGVDVQDINFSSNTEINGSTFDTDVSMSLGNIDSPLPLNDIAITVGTHDLQIEGMSNYVTTMSQFSALDDSNATNPDFMNLWIGAMIDILGPNAGATYDIDMNNDGGNANVKLAVSVIDQSSPNYPSSGLASLTTVRDLLNVTEAELQFRGDAAAIDQTPLAAFLLSPQAEQFVLADGVTYQTSINAKDLIVDINGNPLSLELIMGETLDLALSDMAKL